MKPLLTALAVIGVTALGVIAIAVFANGGDDTPSESGEVFAQPPREEGVVYLDERTEAPTVRAIAGTAVTFLNRDDRVRTVDFEDPGVRDSGRLRPGGAHAVQFERTGTYRYRTAGRSGQISVVEP